MFGELVTAYLFLAGVSAGGVAAASLADLLLVREPFGADVVPDFAEKRPCERLVAGVLAFSCGALALGAGCLAADLGRIDRVLSLFLTPPVTLMNLGAWAVALLTVLAAALALVRFMYLPWADRRAVVVAEVVACGLAVVVAVYAGLLLQTLAGVRLWSTPWVPVLFVLSAASCGCALLMAGALFAEGDEGVRKVAQAAARADAVVIVAEVAAAAGFLAFVAGSDHAGVEACCTARRRCPGGWVSWPAALRRRLSWRSAASFASGGAPARAWAGTRGRIPLGFRFRSLGRIPLRLWLWRPLLYSWALWACGRRWWRPAPSARWSCRKRKRPLPSLPKTRRRQACFPRLPKKTAAKMVPRPKERM